MRLTPMYSYLNCTNYPSYLRFIGRGECYILILPRKVTNSRQPHRRYEYMVTVCPKRRAEGRRSVTYGRNRLRVAFSLGHVHARKLHIMVHTCHGGGYN